MAPKIVQAFIEMEMLEFSFKIWMLDWMSWSSQTSRTVLCPAWSILRSSLEMLEFSFKIWMLDWISWSSQTSRSPVRERGWSAKLHFRTVDFSDCADGGLGGLPKLIQAGPEWCDGLEFPNFSVRDNSLDAEISFRTVQVSWSSLESFPMIQAGPECCGLAPMQEILKMTITTFSFYKLL